MKFNFDNKKQTVIGMAAFISSSILGPLLLFGVAGIFLDKYFQTSPKFVLGGIGIAFVITNFLLFKKIRAVMQMMEDQYPAKTEKRKEE